jgi:hypothetical protein
VGVNVIRTDTLRRLPLALCSAFLAAADSATLTVTTPALRPVALAEPALNALRPDLVLAAIRTDPGAGNLMRNVIALAEADLPAIENSLLGAWGVWPPPPQLTLHGRGGQFPSCSHVGLGQFPSSSQVGLGQFPSSSQVGLGQFPSSSQVGLGQFPSSSQVGGGAGATWRAALVAASLWPAAF